MLLLCFPFFHQPSLRCKVDLLLTVGKYLTTGQPETANNSVHVLWDWADYVPVLPKIYSIKFMIK